MVRNMKQHDTHNSASSVFPNSTAAAVPAMVRPSRFGRVNGQGLITLYLREIQRFTKIIGQTVLAPAVTTGLFMMVFAVALGDRAGHAGSGGFLVFLAPGLVMMAVLQNAFANTSSSMVIGKVQGNIVDLLMPPLTPLELMVAMVGAGITRGLLVGMATLLPLALFGTLPVLFSPGFFSGAALLLALLYLLLGAAIMALCGLIAGIWADKFDNLATITNFVIQPLVFLSGTFYSIERLPSPFDTLVLYNPVYHMIDGFRGSLIGGSGISVVTSLSLLLMVFFTLGCVCWRILASGYKLKA